MVDVVLVHLADFVADGCELLIHVGSDITNFGLNIRQALIHFASEVRKSLIHLQSHFRNLFRWLRS